MIIDRIDPIALRLPINRPAATDALYLVLCKVTVRSGLVGYGECLCLRPASQRSLMAAIRDGIAPLFVGKSVDQRERLNVEARIRLASFGRAGTNLNALAAVDMALWDIAGKAAGRPLSTLLGGAQRTEVPVMASLDRYNDAAKVTARIAQALEAEVAAVKVHEFDLDVIEAARKTAGPRLPFVADCNNAHTMADIQAGLSRWQALDLMFLEDPVWPPEALLEAAAACAGHGRPGRRSRLGRAARGLCAGAFRRRPAARHLHDRRRLGESTGDRPARAAGRFDRAPYAVHRPGRAGDPAGPGNDEGGRLLRGDRGRAAHGHVRRQPASRAGNPPSPFPPVPAWESIPIRPF